MAINKIQRNKKGTGYRVRVKLPSGKFASDTFDRKCDAQAFEAKVRCNKRVAGQEKISFADFCVQFIDLCAKPNMEASSVQRYQSLIKNHLNPRFGRFQLKDISKYELFQFKADVQKMTCSGSTKYFLISALRTIFRRAVELDFLERSPALGLAVPKQSLPRTEYWTDAR